MIPIIAIANLINGLVSTILAIQIYTHFHRRGVVSYSTISGYQHFILLYAALSIMWLLYATPGLLVTNLFIIMVLQSIADVFVYIVAMIGAQISFFALNQKNIGTIVSGVIGSLGIFYIIGRIFSPFPHVREIVYPYVYWHPNIPFWMQMMTGIVASIIAVIFIGTFLVLGFRAHDNTIVFRRSLFLASGMFGLLLASLFFFIYAQGSFISTTLASIFGIGGLWIMMKGIQLEES